MKFTFCRETSETSAMTTECQVCAYPNNRPVTCVYCKYIACFTCVETYILGSINDASCMNCHRKWSRELLVTPAPRGVGLGKTWVSGVYQDHRRTILVERERVNLPDAQLELDRLATQRDEIKRVEALIEQELDQRELQKALLRKKKTQRDKGTISAAAARQDISDAEEAIIRLERRKQVFQQQLAIIKAPAWRPGTELPDPDKIVVKVGEDIITRALMNVGLTADEARAVAAETDLNEAVPDLSPDGTLPTTAAVELHHHGSPTLHARFVKACPLTGCRGFLSSNWKCNTCRHWTCRDCWEIKGTAEESPHQCRAEDLAAVTEIKQSTVACPACGTPVYRISGCNTMFCVGCKTGFNYATQRIINARAIGNPEYYRYRQEEAARRQRELPGAAGVAAADPADAVDPPCCEQLIPYDTILDKIQAIRHHPGVQATYNDIFAAIHEEVITLETTILPKYDPVTNNLDLNLKYLKGELTEDQWKVQLQQREKMNDRNVAFRDILEMVVGVAHDLFDRFRSPELTTAANLVTLLGEFFKLEGYANTELSRVKKIYDSKANIYIDWFDRNATAAPRRAKFLAFWSQMQAEVAQ